MSENNKPKYESGIFGKAEARFGGKISIDVVKFTNTYNVEKYGITLSEFYHGGKVGDVPTDQRVHDPQIFLIFDNVKSIDVLERALESVRERIKRDAENEDAKPQLPSELESLLNQDVRELDFSVRTINIMWAHDIKTVRDLCRLYKTDWLKFHYAGKKSFKEVDDFITAHNLSWGMNV